MTTQKWTGGCHCKKVRYEATVDASNAISCNCSICMKKGAVLAFTPKTNFNLVSGADDLTDYQFNKHVIHHVFCKHCGVGSFSHAKGPDGTDMAAINLRCLDGIELDSVKITPYDGKSV